MCPPHSLVETLREGSYEVELDVDFRPANMLVSETDHKGRSDNVVVFNCHSCHPHMANDGLGAAAVFAYLLNGLKHRILITATS